MVLIGLCCMAMDLDGTRYGCQRVWREKGYSKFWSVLRGYIAFGTNGYGKS